MESLFKKGDVASSDVMLDKLELPDASTEPEYEKFGVSFEAYQLFLIVPIE